MWLDANSNMVEAGPEGSADSQGKSALVTRSLRIFFPLLGLLVE